MKILLGVQTEGNGHITQALAIKSFLEEKNINVALSLSAKKNKPLAKYYTNEFNVKEFDGFDFTFDKNSRVIIWKTFLNNLIKFPKLVVSFLNICRIIKKEKPDIIFNFYEPIIGLTALLFPNIKYISIGHQYAMTQPMYPKVSGFFIQKMFLKAINYVTSIRATTIALSYYAFSSDKVIACPPILRKESYILSNNKENFVLVYLINEDLVPNFLVMAEKYPEKRFEIFTKLTKMFLLPRNVKVFNLDGKLFQEKMKVCEAVICSGGFETSSEAMYQNKPLLMIPLANHFEQVANCNDAFLKNIACTGDNPDYNLLREKDKIDKKWFDSYKTVLESNINLS